MSPELEYNDAYLKRPDGTTIEDLSIQDVAETLLACLKDPGRWDDDNPLIVGRPGVRIAVTPAPGQRLYMVLHEEDAGDTVESTDAMQVQDVVPAIRDFIEGNEDWRERIPWQKQIGDPTRVTFSNGRFYVPTKRGSPDIVTPRRLLRVKRRTMIIEIILVALFGLFAFGGIAAMTTHSFGSDGWMATMGFAVMMAVTATMHWLNWRCPLCGKPLGLPACRRGCDRLMDEAGGQDRHAHT